MVDTMSRDIEDCEDEGSGQLVSTRQEVMGEVFSESACECCATSEVEALMESWHLETKAT